MGSVLHQLGSPTMGWRLYLEDCSVTRLVNWYRLSAGSLARARGISFLQHQLWASLKHGGWIPRVNFPRKSQV